MASAAFGQHEEAVAAFREAIRIDPQFVPAQGNLTGSLIALNRFDQAAAHMKDTEARGMAISSRPRTAYLLAFLANDQAAQARELEAVRRSDQAIWAASLEARSAAFRGETPAAHELYQRAIGIAVGERFTELAAQWAMEDAELHAIDGECETAQREIAAGLELNRDNFTLERAARAHALCGGADVSRLSNELRTRFATATLTSQLQLRVIDAAVAVHAGAFGRAIDVLDAVKPYDHAPAAEFWPAYLRGIAYLGLKDGKSAAPQFQSIVDHRGEAPASPLYALAHLGAARAAALSGDRARARALYEAFFALRSGESRVTIESRREYARLQ
jgi:tetratricopeptide (TPR) repeat protein